MINEEAQIKKRLKEIEKEEEMELLKDPHRIYIPIGKTEEWLNHFGSAEYFTTLYSAANGVGKTTVLANVVRAIVLPTDNEYFQQKLFQDFPYPVKNLRVISNHNTLKETLIPTLKQWLPQGRYETFKDSKEYEYRWEFDSGWSMHILTYDQPINTHESANLSIVLFDEPPPEDVYKANVARLRRGGQIGILATMLDGSEWMYDAIIVSDDKNTVTVTAEVEDACEEHGIRGFLRHSDIERMVSQFEGDDMQARIFGRPQHLTGLVFKMFDKKVHIIPPFRVNPEDYVVWHSLDPHTRNPDAAVWLAIDRNNRYFVVNELKGEGQTEDLVERIKRKDEDYRIYKRLIDPSAFVEDKHTKRSLQRDLSKYGLQYLPGSKRRQDATRKIKDLLRFEAVGGEIIYPPNLFIFETCVNTIYEITHWIYEEWGSKARSNKTPKESGIDKNDHYIEALGRIVIEEPVFIEPEIQYSMNSYIPSPLSTPPVVSTGSKLRDPYD